MFLVLQVYVGYLTYTYYNNLILEKEDAVLLRIMNTYS
jgi:hypothetical protein